jgi:hypothetical protein
LFGFTIIQALVSDLVKIEPWFLITYADQVITYPFLTALPPHVSTTVNFRGETTTSYAPTYLEGLAIMAGYFVLTALGGLLLFEREEFT